jgi:hypothetical protein
MGEPEIAQNPNDPNSLFIVWNTFAYPAASSGSELVPNPCGGAVSMDRGVTWQPDLVPLTPNNPRGNVCADGVTAWGTDGTLLAGGLVTTNTVVHPPPCNPGEILFAGACLLVQGYDAIVRSTDGGKTWSSSIRIMGSAVNGPFTFVGGNPQNTFDRPFLAVDRSTGTVYAAGHNIADHETFVTASTDGGQSFGTIHAADTTYLSNGLPSGTIAAAKGVLAVAYTARSVPGHSCPCVIFETSIDHGATFTPHVVPITDAASVPRPFVAADPADPGHFALTIFDNTGTENQVYMTNDFGRTWHGPTIVAEAPANPRFKPWLSFDSSGQLALVWRTCYGPLPCASPYDVWAAVGRDRDGTGAVFNAAIRVSSVAAPYPPKNPGGGGDDFTFIIADNKYIHVGWGDSRNGRTEAWYGRIRLRESDEFDGGKAH